MAGELGGLEAGAVIGDDDQRDQLAGVGVDAVLSERPAEQVAHAIAGDLERGDRVAVGLGRADRAGQGELAVIVDQAAEVPGAAAGGLEL